MYIKNPILRILTGTVVCAAIVVVTGLLAVLFVERFPPITTGSESYAYAVGVMWVVFIFVLYVFILVAKSTGNALFGGTKNEED